MKKTDKHLAHGLIAIASASLFLSGCATIEGEAGNTAPPTEFQKALTTCAATAAATWLVTHIIDNNTGNRRAGRNDGRTLAVSAVACGIMLASANERDRIIAQERRAAQSRSDMSYNYTTSDGEPAMVRTTGRDVPVPASLRRVPMPGETLPPVTAPQPMPANCRQEMSQLVTAKGTFQVPGQLWCRAPDGDYYPYAQQIASGSGYHQG
ncbi:MAG: hypothetical protein ACXU8U_06110 [Asticcacaulis sp.]